MKEGEREGKEGLGAKNEERGTRVKDCAKNGSRFISCAAKTGLSLLRNQTETLATLLLRFCHAD